MKKQKIYVCENYVPEFNYLIEEGSLDTLEVIPFLSFCNGGLPQKKDLKMDPEGILFCNKYCPASKAYHADKGASFSDLTYCYSLLIPDSFSRFFSEEGYHIVTPGWISHWKKHIEEQGFTQELARVFYSEWCKKILLLDTGVDEESSRYLKEFSAFLDIPFKIIKVSLDPLRDILNKISLDKTHKEDFSENSSQDPDFKELQELNARNAAVFHIMTRIAVVHYQREVIQKLQEIWLGIFGATLTKFWSRMNEPGLPDHIKDLEFNTRQAFIIDKENHTLYVLLESGGVEFGTLEVGGFLFPQNIGKYSSLFDSIARIAGLAISNARRFEELRESKKKYEYKSYHDGLTGLYNRTFYCKKEETLITEFPGCIFSFDLDGLKTMNDTRGHTSGDTLIISAAEVLTLTFRGSDYLIRMGGDEFSAFVNNCNQEQAQQLIFRLEENILKANTNKTLPLSISIGYAVLERKEDSFSEAFQKADSGMYEHKNSKKNECNEF